MKVFVFFLFFFNLNLVFAQSTSTSIAQYSDDEIKPMSVKDLKERLEVSADVFVLNPDGTVLIQEAASVGKWKFGEKGDLTSHWSFSTDKIDPFSFKHYWKIDQKGGISAHIQQYEKIEYDPKKPEEPRLMKLVREEKKVITDFAPIVWEIVRNNKYKIVIQFKISVTQREEIKTVAKVPISGQEMMIIDNKGTVWINSATFSGEYVALKGHRGTLYLSYVPFKGAKEIGVAKGNKIQITVSESYKVTMLSAAPVLPAGLTAKVFGLVDLQKKSTSPNSIHIQTSDKEKEFLEVL